MSQNGGELMSRSPSECSSSGRWFVLRRSSWMAWYGRTISLPLAAVEARWTLARSLRKCPRELAVAGSGGGGWWEWPLADHSLTTHWGQRDWLRPSWGQSIHIIFRGYRDMAEGLCCSHVVLAYYVCVCVCGGGGGGGGILLVTIIMITVKIFVLVY